MEVKTNKKNQHVLMDTEESVIGSLDPNTRNAEKSTCDAVEGITVQGGSGPNATEILIPTDEEDALLESEPNTQQSSSDAANTARTTEGRLKLPGSARKRLKLYLKEGMSIEKARELCLKPMREVRNELCDLKIPRKRGRSDGSSPDKSNPPKRATGSTVDGTSMAKNTSASPVETRISNVQPTYKDMAEVVRLGVIPPDFPATVWSEDKLKLIQTAVLDKIVELKKGSIKPQFAGCSFKPGWLVFNCKGTKSAEWVRENVPSIKPWKDAVMKVVSEEEVPRAEIFIGYFPEKPDTSTNRILSLIEGQNDDLSVELWRVLNRVSKGNVAEITFAIDPNSAAIIKQKGHHIGYGYGTVHIRPSHRQQGPVNDVPSGKKPTDKTDRKKSTNKDGSGSAKPSGSLSVDRASKGKPNPMGKASGSKTDPKTHGEAPSSSRKHAETSGGKSSTGHSKEAFKRPRKGHSSSAEEAVLMGSNRGRKVAAKHRRK